MVVLNMTNGELQKLSSRELHALHARIDEAIRAAIRAKQAAKSSGGPVATGQGAQNEVGSLNLEQERDAWLAARKLGG